MAKELRVWSPFHELERFRRDFDDLFNRFLGSGPTAPGRRDLPAPPIESFTEGDKLIVRADLPGIEPKDVDISVIGNTLVLRGSRESTKEHKERDFTHREVTYGSFERSLTLPEGVRADQIKASYRNGVLELTIALPAEVSTRRVPIEVDTRGTRQTGEPKTH